ncbi:c-type cytochrome [Planktotalea sp.]|uniref:c-type cytochrome n=1 Tax=Planktotalea sp. TaxID=2029877 RepID=UPI0025EB596A|nr:c-type cytochrome [Planktotalea sp.]
MQGSFLTTLTTVVAFFCAAAVNADETAQALGDLETGAKVFKKCAACHKVGEGAKNRVGPMLNGIFDASAGAVEGFKYSKSMKRAAADGLVWDYERLDAFLENPKSMVSGTKMNFRGLKKEQDRHDVLAYLRQFSDDPANIPEAAPTAMAVEIELSPEILALQGDPEYGEYLGSECLTCHQVGGSDQGIPAIVGWPKTDFVVAMHAYKEKLRPHPVMQMMASRLSDEEIAALAAYFRDLE